MHKNADIFQNEEIFITLINTLIRLSCFVIEAPKPMYFDPAQMFLKGISLDKKLYFYILKSVFHKDITEMSEPGLGSHRDHETDHQTLPNLGQDKKLIH